MGKTPGKWIKTLLLGKKSPKSNSANASEILRTAKKEEPVVSVRDDISNSPVVDPPQDVVAPESVDVESRNEMEELELEQAVIKVQVAFRAHQERKASRSLKGIIKLQAVIRGHLVRRQAVATYSCIWGIVKFQALVRGQKARSSDNGIRFRKTLMMVGDSEDLQVSTYSWMDNPGKSVIVDKLLVSSPTAMPLEIRYGPEEPNSAEVWLERWSHFHVWSPGSRAARILVPKTKSKKRNYQAVVETEKARPKRGVRNPNGLNSGNGSNRSSTESEKPKRNARKVSTLSKDLPRTESDKAKHHSRKSRSASKEGSPLDVKDEKPKLSLKRSSLSNGSKKANRKSAEKKKDTADSVKIETEVKVSDVLEGGGEAVESAEKEKEIANSVQIEPEVKVAEVLEVGDDTVEPVDKERNAEDSVQVDPEVKVSDVLEEEHAVESTEKEKDTTEVVPKETDVEKEENLNNEDESKTAETSGKGVPDVKVSSENCNIGFDTTKATERRVSLPKKIDNQDDVHTHSGRKVPSYMAPTASAMARLKGESSPRLSQEKTEKNGIIRRHSLPSPANGKLSSTTTTAMSPRAHKLLLASAKGPINGDKSFSSSKNINNKSNRTEWKR